MAEFVNEEAIYITCRQRRASSRMQMSRTHQPHMDAAAAAHTLHGASIICVFLDKKQLADALFMSLF